MTLNRLAAFAALRRSFGRAPLGVRLHVYGRFASCPMLAVAARLPAGCRLLDLGAGHGAFSVVAVESGAASSAVALEPDLRKLQPPPHRHPRVRPVAGYADALGGSFDAVSVLDVLYRLPLAAWDGFLLAAHAALRPGGTLLLKEIDPTDRLRGAWNRTQERLVDMVGLTLGEAFSYEAPAALAARLVRLGFAPPEVVDLAAGYPHAHVLYVARRPG